MVPFPVPDAPDVIVIQAAWLVAVHAQPGCVVTVMVPVPPVTGYNALVGAVLKVHDGAAPACVIVTVWPAAVMEPVRPVPAALAATEYRTVPSPFPDAPAVMVIQGAWLVAAQGQPGWVVIVMPPVPPSAAYDAAGGAAV